MSWLDKLFNRESTVECRLEVGNATLLRKENKAAIMDIFEVEQVTGKKITTNDLYGRPWNHVIPTTNSAKISASSVGIDVNKLTPEQKAALESVGIFDFG